jgi:hypothetical protein
MSILTFFCQKFCRGANIPTFQLPTGFTGIRVHPSMGEVPPGRGPQCGVSEATFLSISHPGLRRVTGEAGSNSGLALSKYSNIGRIPETAVLYYTSARYRKG